MQLLRNLFKGSLEQGTFCRDSLEDSHVEGVRHHPNVLARLVGLGRAWRDNPVNLHDRSVHIVYGVMEALAEYPDTITSAQC